MGHGNGNDNGNDELTIDDGLSKAGGAAQALTARHARYCDSSRALKRRGSRSKQTVLAVCLVCRSSGGKTRERSFPFSTKRQAQGRWRLRHELWMHMAQVPPRHFPLGLCDSLTPISHLSSTSSSFLLTLPSTSVSILFLLAPDATPWCAPCPCQADIPTHQPTRPDQQIRETTPPHRSSDSALPCSP